MRHNDGKSAPVYETLAVASVDCKMSEEPRAVPAPRRESSDFSIERILSKDVTPSTSSTVKGSCSALSEQTCTNFFDRNPAVVRPSSSFSVQYKVNWFGNFCDFRPSDQRSPADKPKTEEMINESIKRKDKTNAEHFNGEELSWLRCTRYCPPKLPRKSSAGKSVKRKPGSHPRIPFTKHQIDILEDKYKNNAYLARKDVVSLSELLHLPQSRIKIWFQNRRARARRETQLIDQTHATKT